MMGGWGKDVRLSSQEEDLAPSQITKVSGTGNEKKGGVQALPCMWSLGHQNQVSVNHELFWEGGLAAQEQLKAGGELHHSPGVASRS